MKKLVILGAGTGGTIMANKLSQQLPREEWQITVVDKNDTHIYQPGLLFIPFNIYSCNDVIKPRSDYLPKDVDVILSEIDVIEPDKNRVKLDNNKVLNYDYLIIATGSQLKPEETEGLADGGAWYENIFDFYSFKGACQLQKYLKHWEGGHLVLNIAEMPIKCPVAPLEFLFLADWWFTEQGIRDKVDLTFVTPLPGAFTKPKASKYLGDFLDKKNINLVAEFGIERVDTSSNKIISFDEQEIDYDLLVSVPTNMGDDSIERSGIGDELYFIPTHNHTLQSKEHKNIFVIGDATDLPASKAGSVAHFEADVLTENFMRHIEGLPLREIFDSVLEWLDEFEKRGYFSLLQSFFIALDKFVTQLSKEDIKKIADNLPRLLNLLNELNNTSLVDDLEKGVEMYKNMDVQVPDKVSLFTLLKEANDPQVRKGMAMGLFLVKQISMQLQHANNENQTQSLNTAQGGK